MPKDFAYVETHVFSVTGGFNPTTGTNVLTGDSATFDTTTGSWQNFLNGKGTMTWTSARNHSGSGGALRLTMSNASQGPGDRVASPGIQQCCNPGDVVPMSVWVYPSSTVTLFGCWDVGDSNLTYMYTGYATSGVTCPANTWTQVSWVVPALPAGAGSLALSVAFASSSTFPINGTIDIDDAILTTSGQTLQDHISNYVGGIAVATQLDPAKTYWIGLRAVDRTGNISPMSTLVSGTVAQLTGPHYATLSIDDSKIGSLSAGKITVGTLSADVTVASRIKTADSGSRVELNSTGLHAFNSSGTETVHVGSDGSASFIGTITGSTIIGSSIQTAVSGARIVLSNGGGGFTTTQMLFYTGSSYETNPGEISVDVVSGFNNSSLTLAAPDLVANSGLPLVRLVLQSPYSTISGIAVLHAQRFIVGEPYEAATDISFRTNNGAGLEVYDSGASLNVDIDGVIDNGTGLTANRGNIASGSYAYVTYSFGSTMASTPTITSTIDLAGTVVGHTVGWLTTTNYRQFSGSWTAAGGGTVYVTYNCAAGL